MSNQTDCRYSVEGGALCFDGIYIQLASAGEMALASEIERLQAEVEQLKALLNVSACGSHGEVAAAKGLCSWCDGVRKALEGNTQ